MTTRLRGILQVTGLVATVLAAVLVSAAGPASSTVRALLTLACFIPAGAVLWWQRTHSASGSDAELEGLRQRCREQLAELERQSTERQELQAALLRDLQERTEDLEAREQELASRLARFQEFIEYPSEDVHAGRASQALQTLSEQDRAVRRLVETEAERVYEKIRSNGYTTDGQLNLLMIRDEVLELIRRVAMIYRPGSESPLSDVSLEQLARAASRIWLHLLVLLEQLPLPVQQYSIGTLYTWVRRSVVGYGVYQKASPWLTLAARGVSAGRLISGANPAVLGAWWLASELGRQGARKWIEQTVDRQAVGLLRQVISVVGVEAAGIFGTGFRQRDPAWILGTELVELVAAFPPSGESLRNGLTAVTALPLLSEYDRIYLYRCLAAHRSAGLQLADPAMLTREQREGIARSLESFFAARIHGATEQSVRKWREGVESRLDLRLQLESQRPAISASAERQRLQAASGLLDFLADVVQLEGESLESVWSSLPFVAALPATERQRLLGERPAGDRTFAPPDLDPASEFTDLFLKDLMACAVAAAEPSEAIEQLAVETAWYFRRTSEDASKWLDDAWRSRVRWMCVQSETAERLPFGLSRLIVAQRREQERLVFCYGHLQKVTGDVRQELPGAVLLGLQQPDGSARRVAVIGAGEPTLIWTAEAPLTIERVSGVFVDDARIAGGCWSEAESRATGLQISGSFGGGRYAAWFESLLKWAN
ncbi:MAG: hypothetical protein ACKOEO_12755 [Planctomycetaceae bacterium]